MIKIKKSVLEKLQKFKLENLYIVTDFDRTLTTGESDTSWAVLSSSNLMPSSFKEEKEALYQKYRPIEVDETLSDEEKKEAMINWHCESSNLLAKYNIKEEVINNIASNPKTMKLRGGTKEFLKFLNSHNIPIIINSAGIYDFILGFLIANDCYYENIYINSNKLIIKENKVIGMDEKKAVHGYNKNELFLNKDFKEKLRTRKNILLFGDLLTDINMIIPEENNEVINIGFLNEDTVKFEKIYEEQFDILCVDEVSMENIYNLLFKNIL